MKEIFISGQIMPEHWLGENEVTEQDVTSQLANVAAGEDCEIIINSPGGDVFTAVAIFNHIRKFAANHVCTVVMQGIVGSAASYIALAAKVGNAETKIKAYDNSIFFIHNAQAVAYGDYNELEKMAELTKSISNMICDSAYAKVSSDSVSDIHKAMDAETYYFGNEIKEHGYADVVEGLSESEETVNLDKNIFVAKAKSEYKNCMNHIQQWLDKSEDNKKLVAKMSDCVMASLMHRASENNKNNLAEGTNQRLETMEDDKMDVAELKAKNPDVYNAVFEAGVKEERSRVSAHLKMAGDSGDVSAAVDFIANGTPVAANEVTAKYHEVFCKTQLKNARLSDNAPSVNTPAPDKTDVQAEAMSEYKKLMMGGRR